MSRYLLFCENSIRKVSKFIYPSEYNKKELLVSGIRIKNIKVYGETLEKKTSQEKIINDRLLKLKKVVLDILDSDDATDGDYILCLDEISKIRSLLAIYINKIPESRYLKYIKLLNLYESKLSEKYHLKKMSGRKGKR